MTIRQIKQGLLGLGRQQDLFLALLLVAIISLIIFPLPTGMLDGLIASNLGLAITLLIVALYIPNAISLSTFPTLLLLTTLFRLALNIATTRQILINADAGQIIYTFGNFVVAGNFVVGAIIFLIITIVQFVVIAKGSERVAEVGARFTLDALPGKQMSIDADVRAGNIDIKEALKQRAAIQLESSLYGAMDGAMKFVKGDAIAGLIITVINILGGIAVGVLQKEMSVVSAVQTYSLLTIGDGLISQIPALFISISSGIIVTRSNDDGQSNLGNEIGGQLLSQPKGLLISGFLLAGFALVPGFPKLQFVCIGTTILLLGYALMRKRERAAKGHEAHGDPLEKALGVLTPQLRKAKKDGEYAPTIPLQIDLDAGLKPLIDPAALNRELIQIRRTVYRDLGLPFPGIHLNLSSDMTPGNYTILVHEVPVAWGRIKPGHHFVMESVSNLNIIGIEAVADKPFLPGHPTLWVSEKATALLDAAQISYLCPSRLLCYHLSLVLKEHAADLIGLQEVKQLITKMTEDFPDVVEETQKNLSVPQITEILQRLIREEISIRNLNAIFQSLLEWGSTEKDIIMLSEYVRMGLKRYICHRFSGGQNVLAAYILDQEVEEIIRKAIRKTGASNYLVLEPTVSRSILEVIKTQVGDAVRQTLPPVLLTSMDVRRYVRKLLETEIKTLPVLSYQELTTEIAIQPLGRICLQPNVSR
jgi:type III secretion protein V